jgi:hypothetical protein
MDVALGVHEKGVVEVIGRKSPTQAFRDPADLVLQFAPLFDPLNLGSALVPIES